MSQVVSIYPSADESTPLLPPSYDEDLDLRGLPEVWVVFVCDMDNKMPDKAGAHANTMTRKHLFQSP